MTELFWKDSNTQYMEKYLKMGLLHKDHVSDWDKYLQYNGTVKEQGRHGIVGFFKTPPGDDEDVREGTCVFKMSKQINYVSRHEYLVMDQMNKLWEWCPHFCKCMGTFTTRTIPTFRNNKGKRLTNPFDLKSHTSASVEREVLLMQDLESGTKLFDVMQDNGVSDEAVTSLIQQTLVATYIAGYKIDFTHYDLHANNVIVMDCPYDTVLIYRLPGGKVVWIPTYGKYAVVIDYGFAYSSALITHGSMYPSMGYTDIGITAVESDHFSDFKIFSVSTSADLESFRPIEFEYYRHIVKNTFYRCNIDIDSGWSRVSDDDPSDTPSIATMISDELEKTFKSTSSRVFQKYAGNCLDLVQALVVLPVKADPALNNQKSRKLLHKAFRSFLKEFVKIENHIRSSLYVIYILKQLVDLARRLRGDYLKSPTTTISTFRKELINVINSVVQFCRPTGIEYEKMLVSLYSFTRHLEHLTAQHLIKHRQVKHDDVPTDTLPISNPIEMITAIQINDPSPDHNQYQANPNTSFYVIDVEAEQCDEFQLIDTRQLQTINLLHPLLKGKYIRKLMDKVS